ncbi:MAG TPA: CheR family methyltransferase [Polyangiales bacterium]
MADVVSSQPRPDFPVVGIGASAGGLEAFTQLLQRLPPDTGLGFVLIQHLDRTHPSLLSEVLRKATDMPVHQAQHGMLIEPNRVYVIAPDTDLAIQEGQLVVSPRPTDGPGARLPVDFFLRSLAEQLGSRAIGVILSGTASDGTDGLRAIRAENGITFAQDPHSAKFSGMPKSAIDAGVVDYTMDIPELAEELVRLSHHPYREDQEPELSDTDANARDDIFALVRSTLGIDFSEFKLSTVARRLARRVALRRVPDLRAYLTLLEAEPEEVRALYEDILIHVTSFFRDPETFESLRTHVFPEILKHKQDGGTLRVWSAGCSTGEEVYSLAIALLEFLGESIGSHAIQIFGSDVSELAIQKARAGVFSDSTMQGISDERRQRYFSKVIGGYRINRNVRERCVFVRHDLVRDPPFSKLDLVSCRNVLIYFEQALQTKVLRTLHYCLNQPGFLVLGRSENIAGWKQLFSEVDISNKIFMRTAAASTLRFAPRAEAEAPAQRSTIRARGALPEPGTVVAKHLDRLLLARYSPPGVLVNENMDVLLFRGQTGSYLQAASGQPQSNLIGMARGGLIAVLRATLAQAKQAQTVVKAAGVEVDQDGPNKTCDVVVIPFSGLPDTKEPLFVVLFEEPARSAVREPPLARSPDDATDAATERRRSLRLEHELAATKEYLHSLIEEHGRSTEELGASNEELVSGNEELQSMNEELETAKEELQSVNEELSTLNDELRSRNQEVTQVNTDLLNFALTVDIAVLMLDMERRIRRFTPRARSVLNVMQTDVGRPLDDIKLNVEVADLNQQISEVMETNTVKELEVQDRAGHWYRMQIRPYTTSEHAIDGVILSFVDIDALKQLVTEAQGARAEAERANTAKDDFLATLSHELRTPLSSMLLNAQRLSSGDVAEPADLKRVGEALQRSTRLQAQLIDDLLDVSRIVAGKLTLERSPVDLCGVVRSTLEGLSSQIETKALALRVSLAPELDAIWADQVRVQQVVSNLLTNAIKFTPRNGHITIVVDGQDGLARLRVTDTGIGIAPEFLPQVFAQFSQSDSSITRTYGGLGIGLALVRHLVDMHGGQVGAESPGVGRGSTFTVTFPVASAANKAEVESARASERAAALDRPGRTQHYDALVGLRVLVIDDDLRTREALLEVLRLTGAKVEIAGSAAEAMTAVDAFKPQVIVCDIAMPQEDGYAFIRKLRAHEAGGPAIPAVALTALASDADRRRALAVGYQLHLAKPIDIDRLRDAVLELSKWVNPPSAPPAPAPAPATA